MSILTWLLILKIILAIIVTGSFVFFFFAVCSIYANLTTGVPWAKIPKENIDKIFKEISLPKKFLIYDLGCGDGRVLFIAEKLGYRAVGYELSLYPFLKVWLKKKIFRSEIVIERKNFFQADLSPADAVFLFLVDRAIGQVSQKLKKELTKGAAVVSYGFALPGWRLQKTILTKPSLTYVYKI